jgi:hypothetical protein
MKNWLFKLTILTFLFALNYSVLAQKILSESNNIRVSAHAYNDDREGGNERIFHAFEQGVITEQPMRGGSITYRFYDQDLNLVNSNEISPEELFPSKMTLSTTFEIGNKIFGVAYKTTDEKSLNEVCLLEFDQQKLSFRHDFKIISSIAGDGYYKNFRNADLNVELSKGKEKLLISFKLPENGDFIAYRTIIFDRNLDMIEEHDIEFEFNGLPFVPEGLDWYSTFALGDDGTLYTYGYLKGDENLAYYCIVDQGRVRYSEMPGQPNVKLSFRNFTSPVNASEIWLQADFKDLTDDRNGVMMQRMGPHGPEPPIFIKWDNQTLGEYLQRSQSKIDKYTGKGRHFRPENASFKSWKLLDDKSMLLVLERSYSITTTNSNGGSSTTHYSLNILVSRIASDGSVMESTVLRKNQVSKRSSHQGSFVLYSNDILNIFFNDHVSNIGPAWDGQSSRKLGSADGAVALIQIDPSDLSFSRKKHLWVTDDNYNLPFVPNGNGVYKMEEEKYVTWCAASAKRDIVLIESFGNE